MLGTLLPSEQGRPVPFSPAFYIMDPGMEEGRWLPSHSCYCSRDPGLSLQVVLFVYTKALIILRKKKAGYGFALKTDAKCPPSQHFNHLISNRRTVAFIPSNQKALILMPCSWVSVNVLKPLLLQFSFMQSMREFLSPALRVRVGGALAATGEPCQLGNSAPALLKEESR